MPAAARLTDCTAHASPLAPGAGSPSVRIQGIAAWRALPAGVGDGIESASGAMQSLLAKPQLRPPDVVQSLADVAAGLSRSAASAAQHGNASATAGASAALATLNTAGVALAAAYTTAAAIPGGEPAAATAFALGIQAAAGSAMSAAIAAIAGMTDTHTCPLCTPIPHGAGVVTRGSASVFINGLPAARQLDNLIEAAGGSDPIAVGCPTVNIGG